MATNNNQTLNPLARQALDKMKYEVASEIGLGNYQNIDKGNLTSRQNGYVGGNMVKKMVAMAEEYMAQNGTGQVEQVLNSNANIEQPKQFQ